MAPDLESAFGVDGDSDDPTEQDDLSGRDQRDRKAKKHAASEDVLADAFAQRHKGALRYIAFWNRWLEWDGTRWATDATRHAYDLVRGYCKEIGMIASAKTINAAHTFAMADRRLAATPDAWDTEPDAFNQGEDE